MMCKYYRASLFRIKSPVFHSMSVMCLSDQSVPETWKWNWNWYAAIHFYLAHLQLNPLGGKNASLGKRWLKSRWDNLRACVKMLSFRRHESADCNGVIVLMLLLTSELELSDLLRFNTSLLQYSGRSLITNNLCSFITKWKAPAAYI